MGGGDQVISSRNVIGFQKIALSDIDEKQ